MAKKVLTKNQKIGIVIGAVLLVGGIIAMVVASSKKKKKIKACEANGGIWDKDTKQCVSATGSIIQVDVSKDGNTTVNASTDIFGGTKNQTESVSSSPSNTGGGNSSPFTLLPNGMSSCERYVQNHDSAWNYVKCGGTWYTQRKGDSSWTSLAGNTTAINKLEAYSGS